ncbi:unnamed protein product, partial [marine sediment metagenome]
TVKPFEMIGAAWIDGIELSRELNSRKLPGVLFRPVYFSPLMSKYKDKKCEGVQFHTTDREAFLPVLSGHLFFKGDLPGTRGRRKQK